MQNPLQTLTMVRAVFVQSEKQSVSGRSFTILTNVRLSYRYTIAQMIHNK